MGVLRPTGQPGSTRAPSQSGGHGSLQARLEVSQSEPCRTAKFSFYSQGSPHEVELKERCGLLLRLAPRVHPDDAEL